MSNTHEHLEQAEHAVEHHLHDPFNQRVAVSMAIVAACLAGISMAGHRMHNLVLQLQSDANRLRTEASTAEVEKSNYFNWYQSKRNRQSFFETAAKQAELQAGDNPARQKMIDDWMAKAAEYNKSNDTHDNLPDLKERGSEAGKRAEELNAKARTTRDEADHVHHQADRLDIAHLLSEIALVLCSIALLTKKKAFWYSGILATALALGITASAYAISHEQHAASAEGAEASPQHR